LESPLPYQATCSGTVDTNKCAADVELDGNGIPVDEPDLIQKPWRDRSNTIGVIPGKSDDQANSLRRIVEQLPLATGRAIDLTFIGGEVRSVPCDEFFTRQLARGAIVIRTDEDTWDASPVTRYWFETHEDIFFARHLHANIKLFGELLAHVDRHPDDNGFLKLAQRFNLTWTSLDQIRRRISWLQALGLLERWGHSKLVVTDNGRQFLSEIELVTPDGVSGNPNAPEDDVPDLPEPQPFLASALSACRGDDLAERKVLIGYIPKGRKGPGRQSDGVQSGIFEALRNYLDLIGPGASTDEIFDKAESVFAQKKSSFTQSMNTLRNMGLVDLVSFNRFGVPNDIRVILQPGNEVDFVRHLHLRYKFVGELLGGIDENVSAAHLVNVAKSEFGVKQMNDAEIRTRLAFLSEAGLVERIDWFRYRITANGRALAAELALEPPRQSRSNSPTEPSNVVMDAATTTPQRLTELLADLQRFANTGDASSQFEQTVARAFEYFGFHAQHLGGKGQTDVLLTVELSPADRYRAIVDAKSSASGVIGDNAVAFDAIKDHLKKHKAKYAAIVGPEFAPRVKDWAANHRITLITVAELTSLLELHRTAPLTLPQLRVLFESPDDPGERQSL
jgi:hypothetical protein